jgi:hypothetical protein
MDAAYFSSLLAYLQSSGFHDLPGARVSARIPVARALLNRLVADALARSSAPVRAIEIVPRPGDRFEALVTLSWPLVPPLKVTFAIEQQPQFPASPVLVIRWSFLGGLGALALRFIGSLQKLPEGVHLHDDRLVLDIPALAARTPAGQGLRYLKALELHTADDQMVVDLELAVPPAGSHATDATRW